MSCESAGRCDQNVAARQHDSTAAAAAAAARSDNTTSALQTSDDQSFTDEIEIEKHIWHYMLFKHAAALGDLAAKYHCGYSLKRSLAEAGGRTQSRLQVTAPTRHHLSSAYDQLAEMVVKLTEADIVRQNVDLYEKECVEEVEAELKKNDILLMLPAARLIGPATALSAAQSTVTTALNKVGDRHKVYDRQWLTGRVTAADGAQGDTDVFQFDIPLVALTVHIRQGVCTVYLTLFFFSEYWIIANNDILLLRRYLSALILLVE